MSFIKKINKKEDTILLEKYDGEDIQVTEDSKLEHIDKNCECLDK